MTAPLPDGPSLDDLTFPHVSDEQQAIIRGLDDLTDSEKVSALTMLNDWASRDCYGPLTEVQLEESMASMGLALGSDGLWHDAMVPLDPEYPEYGYLFDPSSVA